jgi:hypothetical protein
MALHTLPRLHAWCSCLYLGVCAVFFCLDFSCHFFAWPLDNIFFLFCSSSLFMNRSQHYYSTEYKERVVAYYIEHQSNCSFRSVAKHFALKGGHKLVRIWYNNRHSLNTKPKSGRPTILSRRQIINYVQNKIRAANRSSTPIHYPELLSYVKEKTKKSPSIQTLRRYGRKLFRAKQKRTIKRTEGQRNNTNTVCIQAQCIYVYCFPVCFFMCMFFVSVSYCFHV